MPECYFCLKSGEKSTFRAKSQLLFAKYQRYSTRCQSQFDNSRKRNGISRKNNIGILALLGYIENIFSEIYLEIKICLVKYIFIDFAHNMEYIKCREVDIMSDFQSFLDKTLTQIDVEAIKEEDNEVYEYDIYREIRELVIAARDRAGLTQKELAAKSGLTQSNISNIEKGSTRPTIDSLKKIADATGKRLVIQFGDREVML